MWVRFTFPTIEGASDSFDWWVSLEEPFQDLREYFWERAISAEILEVGVGR